MTGRQHATIGFGLALPAGIALAALPGLPPWMSGSLGLMPPLVGVAMALLVVGGGLVGALLPDLDTDRSLLEAAPRLGLRRLWRGGWGLLLLPLAPLLLLLMLLLWVLNETVMRFTDHRGATHGFTALALVTAATLALTAWAVGPPLAAGLAVGYASHLAADALTPRGVELSAPWSRRRWYLLPRPFRFGGESWRAGCLATMTLAGGLALAAWQVWRLAGGWS